MSVKISNWAWHHSPEAIAGNAFIVLMALADIADDEGNCVFADREKRLQESLAAKARISVRTFQRVIRQLEEFGVLAVDQTGRENSYRVVTDTRQVVVLVTPSGIGDNLSSDDTSGGSDPSTVADHKDVLTYDLNQSSLGIPTEPAALRADDGVSSSDRLSLSARVRRSRSKRALDVELLNQGVGDVFVDVQGAENARRIVYLVALRILGKAAKAGTDLVDPTRYVITAVLDEPDVWRKFAFGLDVRP